MCIYGGAVKMIKRKKFPTFNAPTPEKKLGNIQNLCMHCSKHSVYLCSEWFGLAGGSVYNQYWWQNAGSLRSWQVCQGGRGGKGCHDLHFSLYCIFSLHSCSNISRCGNCSMSNIVSISKNSILCTVQLCWSDQSILIFCFCFCLTWSWSNVEGLIWTKPEY